MRSFRNPCARHLLPLAAGLLVFIAPSKAETPLAAPIGPAIPAAEQRELQREARLIVDLVQNLHYTERTFREIPAAAFLDSYVEALDPGGWFLPGDDRKYIHKRLDRVLKSVYIMNGDTAPAFEIHSLLFERASARLDRVAQRLDQPFDISVDETYDPSSYEKPPTDLTEADRRWEARLKDELIQEMVVGRTLSEAAAAARKRYESLRKQLAGLDQQAVRELYLEMILRTFDAHSGYFSADSAREFSVEMAGAVTGVGIDLARQEGRCVVVSLAAGGPAERDGSLKSGDTLLATAQAEGPWAPTAGRLLRDIVAAVRGEVGTSVRLAFQPAGSEERREITLVRAKVVRESDRASAALAVLPGNDTAKGRRIGWISLPAFYANSDTATPSSAADDMRTLISMLQEQGIEGLVLDLRHNPGGAMQEALKIAGLFLPGGVGLLTRIHDGTIEPMEIPRGEPLYRGPLVCLVSSASASASELLSAALQYHRRAIIAGAPRTFGKGTAQNYIDLSRSPQHKPGSAVMWGTLRLTMERFSGPDGSRPQGCGVAADIAFYELPSGVHRLETDLPHALPAETITPPAGVSPITGDFFTLTSETISDLRKFHQQRRTGLVEMQLWQREHELRDKWQADGPRSLVLETRRKAWDELESRYQEQRRERRALAAAQAYPTTVLDIPEVRTARLARQKSLQEKATAAARITGSIFWGRTAEGSLQEVPLSYFDFRRATGDAPALARSFAAASGHAIEAPEIAALLRDLSQLPDPTEAGLRSCFLQHIPSSILAPDRLEAGLSAFLQQLAEIDGEVLRERPALDIGLRESLRLAADWADIASSKSIPAASTKP